LFGVEFRPLTFGDVLGLDDAKDILRRILHTGDYDAGYIFGGSHATGKTTLGRIFARAVLCEHRREDMSPCNECKSCRDFLAERNPGYIEIDAANQGTKDNIQAIKDSLRYETLSSRKIILFDEAHDISEAGKDALLIPLERGDKSVLFIFCTTEPEKMHNTLRSRCMEFAIQDPSEALVRQKLEIICGAKKLPSDREALEDIVRSVGRHYRDAENKLRQVSLLGDISRENVKKAVSLYVDEAAGLLLTLPDDLGRALKFADYLVLKMSVHRIYSLVVRMLVDSVKASNGVAFGEGRYQELLRAISRRYGAMAYEVVDYLVSKNRLNDQQMFQSDLLVLHYRFRKGSFVPKEQPSAARAAEEPRQAAAVGTAPGTAALKAPTVTELSRMPDGKREDVVREYKESRRRQRVDERVPERVSGAWGPEKKENTEELIHRRPVSKAELERVLKGTLDEKRI